MKREIGPELVARIRHVADSLQPVERTPQPYPTPSEGSVQGEGTPPESYEDNDEKRTNTTTHRGVDRMAYEGDIVSRLRHWRGLHLAHGGELFDEAANEIARLRLTAAEREAIHHVVGDVADIAGSVEDTLRNLLERLQ